MIFSLGHLLCLRGAQRSPCSGGWGGGGRGEWGHERDLSIAARLVHKSLKGANCGTWQRRGWVGRRLEKLGTWIHGLQSSRNG